VVAVLLGILTIPYNSKVVIRTDSATTIAVLEKVKGHSNKKLNDRANLLVKEKTKKEECIEASARLAYSKTIQCIEQDDRK
ncbi:18756_t:CDS:2, partial [Gigaspora margarita]